MNVERGVDRFAKALEERVTTTVPQLQDALLFALDDLQRQIDELKEERR